MCLFGSTQISGDGPTLPSLRPNSNPKPAPTQTLGLREGRVGPSPGNLDWLIPFYWACLIGCLLPLRTLLWHGSRLTNWVGILSRGLRIAPPEAPVTGYMVRDAGLYGTWRGTWYVTGYMVRDGVHGTWRVTWYVSWYVWRPFSIFGTSWSVCKYWSPLCRCRSSLTTKGQDWWILLSYWD